MGHAGARLPADPADVTGLTSAYYARSNRFGHEAPVMTRGRIAIDLAVMPADGGKAITDLAMLRDQGAEFGPASSTPTAWRLPDAVDDRHLRPARHPRPDRQDTSGSRRHHPGAHHRKPGKDLTPERRTVNPTHSRHRRPDARTIPRIKT
ncbi:hypothetical protein ACFWB2_44390 [Streptomyces virginiae]|uniref:hypothetical protein n=1 Tax=Streptomyces virginiae TaxID=1961 RepID=UPI0036978E6B